MSTRTFHAAAGEFLVLGELLRRGIEAYLAQGPTQPGWDIIVRKNDAFTKVQVKTIDWPAYTAVNIKTSTVRGHDDQSDAEQHFDVMVVVLLQWKQPHSGKPHSRFLMLTPEEIQCHWTEPKKTRSEWTLTVSKDLASLQSYEDAWDKL